jgi:hypothetical protein
MSKLYVNGCSFTQGHYDTETVRPHETDWKTWYKLDAPWSWARQLEGKQFDTVINEAYCGCSNDRIFRRTMEFIGKTPNIQDWTIILQFTNVFRYEWHYFESDVWINQLMHRSVFDDRGFARQDVDRDYIRRASDDVARLQSIVQSAHKVYFDFYCKLLAFEKFAQSHGIEKIMYTSLSNINNPQYLHKVLDLLINKPINFAQNPVLNRDYPQGMKRDDAVLHYNLLNKIEMSRCIRSMSEITKGHEESAEDSHPNQVGHNLFHRYIITELKARDYI